MAPPTAGIEFGSPVSQLARSPMRETWNAPSTVIEVTAAHHRERRYVLCDGGPRQEAHEFLACIDDVGIVPPILRHVGHANDAILAVQNDFAVFGQVLRDRGRHADAKIDVSAVGNVARDEFANLCPLEFLPNSHCGFLHSTTRCKKIPGVITCSGVKAPSGTIS